MKISCCINTYKRPKFLKDLLWSLDRQKLPEACSLEIIIVDNDPEHLGRPVVKKGLEELNLEIKYFCQPIKNISLTRNKAVEKASGDLILFVDDDGITDENWIREMVSCFEKFEADGVFGAVLPYFDPNTPQWLKTSGFFDRLVQKSGEISKFMRTGNCLIKSSLLKTMEGPFNPEFGLTGGEDSNLFRKLKNNGAKFVFCAEGIVYDYVPLERANLNYLIKRRFRNGITFVKNHIGRSDHKTGIRILYFFRSLSLLSCYFFLSLIAFPVKKQRIKFLLRSISYSGHLAAVFNINYQEYQ